MPVRHASHLQTTSASWPFQGMQLFGGGQQLHGAAILSQLGGLQAAFRLMSASMSMRVGWVSSAGLGMLYPFRPFHRLGQWGAVSMARQATRHLADDAQPVDLVGRDDFHFFGGASLASAT